MNYRFILKLELIILLFSIIGFFIYLKSKPTIKSQTYVTKTPIENYQPQVLGEDTSLFNQVINVPENFVNLFSTTSALPSGNPTKNHYSIALYGDSMIETMGSLSLLSSTLIKKYPEVSFSLYNFGIGSQNIQQGLNRLNQPLNRDTRQYSSIIDLKPDIIILGSFAYNPFYPYDKKEYQMVLTQLISQLKQITSNVYLLAEMAPLKNNFGKGPGGVNWPDDMAYEHATRIIEQMETAIQTANEMKIPVINVYEATRNNIDKASDPKLVSSYDGIHPSALGHQLIAKFIAAIINPD
jgi:lysophospholipase L1-like esterase